MNPYDNGLGHPHSSASGSPPIPYNYDASILSSPAVPYRSPPLPSPDYEGKFVQGEAFPAQPVPVPTGTRTPFFRTVTGIIILILLAIAITAGTVGGAVGSTCNRRTAVAASDSRSTAAANAPATVTVTGTGVSQPMATAVALAVVTASTSVVVTASGGGSAFTLTEYGMTFDVETVKATAPLRATAVASARAVVTVGAVLRYNGVTTTGYATATGVTTVTAIATA